MRQTTFGGALMRMRGGAPVVVASLVVAIAATPTPAAAQNPNLGSAETFGVLAGSTVTNSGATTVGGDVGVGPAAISKAQPSPSPLAARSTKATPWPCRRSWMFRKPTTTL